MCPKHPQDQSISHQKERCSVALQKAGKEDLCYIDIQFSMKEEKI